MQKKGCLSKVYFLLSAVVVFSEAHNDGVVPFQYRFIIDQEAENGSLAVGNCSDTVNAGSATVCRQPASSVLFDGKTPTLTGLSGNMWASQLFTLSSAEDECRSNSLSFEFDTTGFIGVWGVEVTMFNCPDWGLAVQDIILQNRRGESILSSGQLPSSSCTSLVTVMLCSQRQLRFSEIHMVFDLQPNSDRMYIAEMTFFPTSVICDTVDTPPLLIDTTAYLQPTTTIGSSTPQDRTIAQADTTPQGGTPTDITIPASTTNPAGITLPPTTEFDSPLRTVHSNVDLNTTTPIEASSELNYFPTSTIILATVLTAVLIALCLLAAVLILWRCCYVKHYKHNTNHHPAVGEGRANTHSHPPPVTLSEETGQAYYTAAEKVDSSLVLKQETPKPSNSPSGEYDVIKTKENRAYSVALVGHGSTQDTPTRDVAAPVYSAIDGKKEKPIETERSKAVSAPLACSITDTDKPERKYASVRGKSNETEQEATSNEPAGHVYAVPERKISPESGTSTAHGESVLDRDVQLLPQVNANTGHVYAVLENKGIQQPPDVDVSTGHLYAVPERKISPESGTSTVHGDSVLGRDVQVNASTGHVYAVLENKCIQQPPDVDISTGHVYAVLENEDVQQQVDVNTGHVYALLEREDAQTSEEGVVESTLNNQLHTADAAHFYTPEADIPVQKLYTQVDKKKKDGDTSTHSHTPEADKPVDKMYTQVDKKKKERKRKGKEV